MDLSLSRPALVGRTPEVGRLRSLLDAPRPRIVRVEGPPGAGKSALVEHATTPFRVLRVPCPPLPAPAQFATLRAALGGVDVADGDWTGLLDAAAARAAGGERPSVLVLDDAHRLVEARARVGAALAAATDPSRERSGAPLHLVLVGPPGTLPEARPAGPRREEPPEGLEEPERVSVGPLDVRAAALWLPGRSAADVIRAYSVFGGLPARLVHLDPDATLQTNARRLFFAGDAPFARAGIAMLERAVQTPARYAAVLAHLARGESDWRGVHAAVADLGTSGQLAPYLSRLRDMGLVEARRSLDARPGSRNRRYRIVDAFDAFWFRFVLPLGWAHGASTDGRWRDPGAVAPRPPRPDPWRREVLPELGRHVASVFPAVCRAFMERHADEVLAGRGRTVGSLWASDHEIDVAGTLTTGSPFYGLATWPSAPDTALLARLDRSVSATRYGFGRERRLRLLFGPRPFSTLLQRAVARRDDAALVDPRTLLGRR